MKNSRIRSAVAPLTEDEMPVSLSTKVEFPLFQWPVRFAEKIFADIKVSVVCKWLFMSKN